MSIYPFLLQKIILPFGGLFFGKMYLKTISKWNKYDHYDLERLQLLQAKKTESILKYCIKNVPLYNGNSYDDSLSSEQNLKKFPVLTKTILRNDLLQLVSKEYDVNNLEKHHSSGSTGIQSFTYMTKEHTFMIRGIQTTWFQSSGYKPGLPILQFGMTPKRTIPKKLKDLFFNVLYVNSFFLNKEDILINAKKIHKKKIKFIAGYPSEINELAKVVINNNLEYNAQGLVSFGDKLLPSYETNYRKAFGKDLKIIDTYGCAEGLLIACKKDNNGYLVNMPHVFVEVVDDFGNEVEDGEIGHLLITCLTNKAMPIIRYKLGDLGVKMPKANYPKDSQYKHQRLERIVGRETDYIKTTDDTRIFVTTFVAILEFYTQIEQFKILQNDKKSIVLEYKTNENFDLEESILSKLISELKYATKNQLEITLVKVEKISSSKSGKPQIIESKIIA